MYRPPKHYTEQELEEAALADMETDLRCAIRDNLPEYANKVRDEIAALKARRMAQEGKP